MNKVAWRLALLFVFIMPLSSFLSVRILLALFLLACFFFYKNNLINVFFKKNWDVILFLSALSIGLFYSEDRDAGFKVLETNFSLLAIPIVFSSFNSIDEKRIKDIFSCFILGLLLSCLICLVNSSLVYIEDHNIQVFFFYALTGIIGFQPTYFAYYLVGGIAYCLYTLYYYKDEINPWVLIGIFSFFFFMLMLTGGQTAFISMLFVFSFFILKFLVEEGSKMRSFIFVLIGIMMSCMFLISSGGHDNRNLILNDSFERFILWDAAIKAMPNIIWGVGTGDYKEVLNNYYLTHDLNQFAEGNYNSHNQFIQSLLTNGLLGLFSVVILICRPLYLSVKNNNILGVLVFFPFLIYGMTEVFLGRYQGIVFFALLHQIFISHYSSVKSPTSQLKAV